MKTLLISSAHDAYTVCTIHAHVPPTVYSSLIWQCVFDALPASSLSDTLASQTPSQQQHSHVQEFLHCPQWTKRRHFRKQAYTIHMYNTCTRTCTYHKIEKMSCLERNILTHWGACTLSSWYVYPFFFDNALFNFLIFPFLIGIVMKSIVSPMKCSVYV